jgi:succinate dehydrogenase/fumarate reductase-like Fe-S protein
MLHTNDIEHRFYFVERAVRLAAQAGSAEPGLPRELRQCLERIDKLADDARDVLPTKDAPRIRKLVRDMDLQADRAKRICDYIPTLSAQIKSAVTHLHGQMQELKRDMSS